MFRKVHHWSQKMNPPRLQPRTPRHLGSVLHQVGFNVLLMPWFLFKMFTLSAKTLWFRSWIDGFTSGLNIQSSEGGC